MKACGALLLVLLCVCEADPDIQLRLTHEEDQGTELELTLDHHDHHGTTDTEDTALLAQLSSLEARLNATEERLSTRLNAIERQNAAVGPKVAFSASLSDDAWSYYGPGAPETIVFKNVLFNNGNAYNPTTGFFTASHKGAYLFTFSTLGGSTSYENGAKLMKNGVVQVSTWDHKGPEGTMTGAVILSLNATDTVNMMTKGDGFQIFDNSDHYSTFSGVLLFPL